MKLDELLALNDEMIALSRAGVPLGHGLLQVGGDLPGNLGRLATMIGARLESGESLEQVLASAQVGAPPAYRAVVLAGLRSGKLTAALEGMATALRRVAELRRIAGLALLYPLIVVVTAAMLFAFVVHRSFGVMRDTVAAQAVEQTFTWDSWLAWGQSYGHWLWLAAPVILFLAGCWWWRTGRAGQSDHWTSLGLLPGAGRLLRSGRTAALADLLSLLVAQRVPITDALPLAAETCGSRDMQRDARQVAQALAQGRRVAAAAEHHRGLPPLIRWLVTNPLATHDLSAALRRIADSYYHIAQFQGEAARLYIPLLATIAIGGTVTVLYAMAFFGPWMGLLREISESVGR